MVNFMGSIEKRNRTVAVNEFPTALYINGRWIESSEGKKFPVFNPATEAVVAEVSDADIVDAQCAVDAAARALPAWAGKSPRQRSEILYKSFEIVSRQKEHLARLMTLENGKALKDSNAEVTYAAEFLRWYAEECVRISGEVMQAPASGAQILVQYRPAGVAVLVTPWNFPAAMGTRKIAPALAAGCSVVVKPASETPLTMLALAECFAEAGVPPGVVNIVPSSKSASVVSHMLSDSRVRVVSFTGSTEVGRNLLRESAHNVINPAMELGGNAPFIVLEDADIDAAVEGAVVAKMRNSGETCTAVNRIYVHDKRHDVFAERLTSRMSALKVGNGLDNGVDVGPLVNAGTRNKVAGFVEDAVKRGARVLTGGQMPTGIGFFYPPTVIVGVPEDAKCVREEIFGPVAAIQRFADDEEVIFKANNTEYGLVAYIYSENLKRALGLANKLEFGMVGINRGLVSDPAAPFGGMKSSGIGREGGREGLFEFLEPQYISTNW